jgi:hypothetical protein
VLGFNTQQRRAVVHHVVTNIKQHVVELKCFLQKNVEQAKVDKLSECILWKQLAVNIGAVAKRTTRSGNIDADFFIFGICRVSDKTLNKDYVTLGKERGYMAAPSETRLWNF